MIDIKYTEVNVTNSTILLHLTDDTTLTLNLSSIEPTNQADALALAESLDWSNAVPGKSYHLESGVLTETPPSPGPTYKFDYITNTWQDTRTQEEMWRIVRLDRDVLLKASDWTQMPDVQLPNKPAWAIYRQALRDITNQSDPFNITWPTAPGA